MAYPENWNYTGDIYVSQKFGEFANDDPNLGSATTPFKRYTEALASIPNGTSGKKTLIIKSGRYQEMTSTDNAISVELIADGNVELDGMGIAHWGHTHGSYGYRIIGINMRDFLLARRFEVENSSVFNCKSFYCVGGYGSNFENVEIITSSQGNSGLKKYQLELQNCNFLNCKIIRSQNIIFRNCYFDDQTVFEFHAAAEQTLEFHNCAFQTNNSATTNINGTPIKSYTSSTSIMLINCIFPSDPLFNNRDFNNPIYNDLTLQYSPTKSPLYLGRGLFIGAHKFAKPITNTSVAFQLESTPIDTELDPILDNVTLGSNGEIQFAPSESSFQIRSSGHPAKRLQFITPRLVNEPFRFVGSFFYPFETFDLDRTNDRPTYKMRYIDPDSGNWLPSASTWYTMRVNAPWQIDGAGLGNGDSAFDINTAEFVRCQEFQLDLTLHSIKDELLES